VSRRPSSWSGQRIVSVGPTGCSIQHARVSTAVNRCRTIRSRGAGGYGREVSAGASRSSEDLRGVDPTTGRGATRRASGDAANHGRLGDPLRTQAWRALCAALEGHRRSGTPADGPRAVGPYGVARHAPIRPQGCGSAPRGVDLQNSSRAVNDISRGMEYCPGENSLSRATTNMRLATFCMSNRKVNRGRLLASRSTSTATVASAVT